jgi:hypothetical protein
MFLNSFFIFASRVCEARLILTSSKHLNKFQQFQNGENLSFSIHAHIPMMLLFQASTSNHKFKIVELSEQIAVLEKEKRKEFSIHETNKETFLSFDHRQWSQFEQKHENEFQETIEIDRTTFQIEKYLISKKDESKWLKISKINNV